MTHTETTIITANPTRTEPDPIDRGQPDTLEAVDERMEQGPHHGRDHERDHQSCERPEGRGCDGGSRGSSRRRPSTSVRSVEGCRRVRRLSRSS